MDLASRALCVVILIASACGGDDDGGGGSGRADARPLSDGGGGGDAASEPDGGGDEGPVLIWAHGDFAVDNRTQLAAFAPDAALPATPSLVIPGGEVAQVAQTGSSDYGPYDISPDRTRVAFAADLEVAGRFDLYVAGVDGSEPVQVVAAGADADVERVRFSPDGSRIAFTADLDTDNQLDAYVVAADAEAATPVRVSPPHMTTSSDLDTDDLVWATDSRSLVMTGDFTLQDFHEMWIADVTAAEPAPIALIDRDRIASTAAGVKGVVLPLLVDGGRVLFKSRMDADDRYKLTLIDTDGQNEDTLLNSEIARVDDSIADIGTIGLSPDRSQIAFSADQVATIYDLWVMPIDGSMAPTQLTTGLDVEDTNPSHGEPLKWSPDGSAIAFVADYRDDNSYEPYLVPTSGGGQKLLATISTVTNDGKDAITLTWSPAGDALYVIADLLTANESELFRLDPGLVDQTPALALDVPTGGDLSGVRASD